MREIARCRPSERCGAADARRERRREERGAAMGRSVRSSRRGRCVASQMPASMRRLTTATRFGRPPIKVVSPLVERLLRDERVHPVGQQPMMRFSRVVATLSSWSDCFKTSVDPSAEQGAAIRSAAENGHLAVVERVMRDVRVSASAGDNNIAISREGISHCSIDCCKTNASIEPMRRRSSTPRCRRRR